MQGVPSQHSKIAVLTVHNEWSVEIIHENETGVTLRYFPWSYFSRYD